MSNTFLEISACCDSWFLSRQPYGFLCPAIPLLPFILCGPQLCKVPVRARSRSDNCAAVLRLQNTQPKDRRIYTAFTGILAGRQPVQDVPEQDGKGAAQGSRGQ